ncbi:MAG: hypothetical protein V9E82_12480 [Candidatus Nanopelagicales bacterium]
MPLAEGAPAAVLTAEPHVAAFQEQGPEGQGLAHRPVDRAVLDHLRPALQLRLQAVVDADALRQRHLGVDDVFESLLTDRGVHVRRVLHDGHRLGLHRLLQGFAGLGEHPLQLRLIVLQGLLGILLREVTALDQ